MNLSDRTFEGNPGPRMVFGVGVAGQLAMQIQMLGKSNALIVTDKGVAAAGIVDQVAAGLKSGGIEYLVFDGVQPNPTMANVQAGAEMLRSVKDAVVVPLGGGSSMDAAKAIALVGPNGGSPADFQFGCQPEQPANPIVAVPTTSGTGSETNMWAMITNEDMGRKMYVAHPSATAQLCILDPALCVGMPPHVTAACGMDVLTHAIEGFTAMGATAYTDGQALQAIAIVAAWLPKAFDDGSDIEARAQMHLASHLAAIAFNTAGLGIAHGMGHPMSARFGLAHGQTLATVLPTIMEFNTDAVEAKYAQVALAMGAGSYGASDAANAKAAIQAVIDLRARVGCDKTLTDLGISSDAIPQLTEDVGMELIMMTTPKPAMAEQIAELYEAVL